MRLSFKGYLRLWAIVWALGCSSSALAQAALRLAPGVGNLPAGAKVLMAPLDIELFSVSAGGVATPEAKWTQDAEKFMRVALVQRLKLSQVELVDAPAAEVDAHTEALNLHAAVAGAISFHQFGPSNFRLPTKEGQLDWSFGDVFMPLAQRTGAQYGLFIWVRDGYATAERKAAMVGGIILGALTGIAIIPGGVPQTGYASLVDLNTGGSCGSTSCSAPVVICVRRSLQRNRLRPCSRPFRWHRHAEHPMLRRARPQACPFIRRNLKRHETPLTAGCLDGLWLRSCWHGQLPAQLGTSR